LKIAEARRHLAAEYREGLERYRDCVRSLAPDTDLGPFRLEAQFENLRDWSLFLSREQVGRWFLELRERCPMRVERVPLNRIKGWVTDPETGDMRHESGEFFTLHGIRVEHAERREVSSKSWEQPIFTQVGYVGGILGILRKRFLGIPHYLIEAKAEPGNYEKLQLSPTVQATYSNLKRAHKGSKTRFAEIFEDPARFDAEVLYRAWLAEDGGRLFLKRNLGMIVEVPESTEIEADLEGFLWMSLHQLKACHMEDAWVNPHVRGIIAHL
jgi:oxidase EvaA